MTEKPELNEYFEVLVDDNFHYQDESERYRHGEYASWEAAVDACKQIVDGELLHLHKPGESASELYSSYTGFGEDPFIRPNPPGRKFSAWEYARQRCDEICANGESGEVKMSSEGDEE